MRFTLTARGVGCEIDVTPATRLDVDVTTLEVRLDGVVIGTLTDTTPAFWSLAQGAPLVSTAIVVLYPLGDHPPQVYGPFPLQVAQALFRHFMDQIPEGRHRVFCINAPAERPS